MSWLDRIDVASPCSESWADMSGDERARHCDKCEQTVYDLSGMTRSEALALVRRSAAGEEVCVRFRRRADGTVLTADCPSQVRRSRVRSKSRGLRTLAAGALALAGGAFAQGCTGEASPEQPPRQPAPGKRLPQAGGGEAGGASGEGDPRRGGGPCGDEEAPGEKTQEADPKVLLEPKREPGPVDPRPEEEPMMGAMVCPDELQRELRETAPEPNPEPDHEPDPEPAQEKPQEDAK